MRRIALAVAAVMVTTAGITGITLVSAGMASAQPSCTSSTAFLVDTVPKITVNIPTVGTQTGQDNCLLGVGNDNPGVGVLQRDLNICYGQHLAVDNIYGPLTRAAVVHAQSVSGATPDGVYGPQTRDHILWINSHGHCQRF
jgi:peptidoglycan hydrolase-like protein with peptidoglycan-binding domain